VNRSGDHRRAATTVAWSEKQKSGFFISGCSGHERRRIFLRSLYILFKKPVVQAANPFCPGSVRWRKAERPFSPLCAKDEPERKPQAVWKVRNMQGKQ